MKTRTTMVVIAMMMFLQFVHGTEPQLKFGSTEKKLAYATKNLLTALRSDNPGVVESAIRMTARMKMRYPATDVTILVRVIDDIWQKHPSGTLRYKAYIVSNICMNPEWYSNEQNITTADDDNFFRAASTRLQEKLLSANSL